MDALQERAEKPDGRQHARRAVNLTAMHGWEWRRKRGKPQTRTNALDLVKVFLSNYPDPSIPARFLKPGASTLLVGLDIEGSLADGFSRRRRST